MLQSGEHMDVPCAGNVEYITIDNRGSRRVFSNILAQYLCSKIPSPENQWQGENINRFCSADYDALHAELTTTTELAKRQEIAKKLNDMLTKDSMTIIPLVHRGTLSAHSNALGGVQINAWDMETWNTADWFRIK